MKILSFLFAAFFVLSSAAAAQRSPFEDDKMIENKVEQLLARRDVGELANELARQKSAATEDLLIKLSVFARAGHRARVLETLNELGKIYPAAKNREQILRVVRRTLDYGDLPAKRLFYERFVPEGDQDLWNFISAWQQNGDAAELEKWLAARASQSETWWWHWVDLKKSRRSAAPIADDLARLIRQNPADFALVKKYLRVVGTPVYKSIAESSPIISDVYFESDVSWLAEAVKTESPFELFYLGVILQNQYPQAAAGLFERSLALGYSETDARLVEAYFSKRTFDGKPIANPEKNFRGWTKRALVALYRRTDQLPRAQPLIEQLTADGVTELDSLNNFSSAGAVQAATGARQVEVRLLSEEKLNENSPDYWINRAAYYVGRGETAEVRETFRRALEKFPYVANDPAASDRRLKIVYFYGWQADGRDRIALLRGEFARARDGGDLYYLYELLRYLNEDDDDPLRDEFFVNTDLLPKVLAARPQWLYNDPATDQCCVVGSMIERVLKSERWDAKKRAAVWDELAALAGRDLSVRAYSLVDAMKNLDEDRRAVALLEESLKIAPEESGADDFFDRQSLSRELFDSYLALGEFGKAEKLYAGGFRDRGNELARIAVAAAQSGKIGDAVRVWKTHANLDRRSYQELYELAKTAAKTPLREFYEQMKAKDPLSDVPDRALQFLK